IYHPLVRAGPAAPIIIYLPPGPVASVNQPTLNVPSALSAAASATVVQIDYRLSKEHKYPTPIHDVLRGYDWILEHLVPARPFHQPGRNSRHTAPIAVCGELIGGGLATMLALTECRLTGPCVAAAAVNEPIVDWIFPQEDELDDLEDAIDFDGGSGVKPARSSYFHKPGDYFDPFASSVLFFRTAGIGVPSVPATAPLDDFAELAKYEREDFLRQQLKLSSVGVDLVGQGQAGGAAEASKPTRKSYKRWPGAASGLKLPDVRVSFGDTSPLSDQAVELAMLIRRSIIAQSKKTSVNEEQADRNREEAFEYAENRVQLHATEGIRFWDSERTQELRRAAQWLREVLERD
ncbi:hypothetical protein BDV97DRAFT_295447, partial [Delphinella strobiligena]